MFAKVILGRQSKNLDKLLDYKIPDGMTLETGDSVLVPFGAKNKPVQAAVAAVCAISEYPKVKEIIEKLPIGKCFDEDMLELIFWMRQKYLCSYEEAASVVIPAGTSLKSSEWILLENENGRYSEICEALKINGGAMEYKRLIDMFDKDVSHKISRMVKDGELKREFSSSASVSIKTVRVAGLAVTRDEAFDFKKQNEKKYPVWAEIIDILMMNEFVSVKDLKLFSGAGASAVKTLEKKGIIRFSEVPIFRVPKNLYKRQEESFTLTEEQETAIAELKTGASSGEYCGYLLFGVTGSGKTEVYMQVIASVIAEGKQAIVLVPEISLTPQTVNRFTSRFGDRVAVLHSGLSIGERFDQWRRIRSGDIDIVIGARSAIFAPLKNPGIIIIDEEHSDTYKSEKAPRYETKEIAEFRARQNKAVLLLASATPSVESFYKTKNGVLHILTMEKRANRSALPDVSIVDMRDELSGGNKSMLSEKLCCEIEENLKRHEQTILFLNRRGFSTFVSCRECGFVARCPSCNISLTYHKFDNSLQCHYCGHTVGNYTVCPKCGSKYIRYFGGGTQKVEEEIRKKFPGASIIRMDIDTTGKKQSHEEILKTFETEKTDILVGTQMVTKGLDFENVTLVGVICADTMLHIDDFRSGERTFDILEQVTGRAGRGRKAGRAVIQTYSPDHEAVLLAVSHDYAGFYDSEIKMRDILWYPPYCNMVCIGFSGISFNNVSDCARDYFKALKTSPVQGRWEVLGPIPSAVSKIKNRYRWQILVKCENADRITPVLLDIKRGLDGNDNYRETVIVIDKNPLHVY